MLLASLVLSAHAATWPPGTVVNPGISIDITKGGFDAVAALVPELLPESIDVGTVGGGDPGWLDQCWIGGYEYELSGAVAYVEVTGAEIAPGDGVLDITAHLLVAMNDPADEFQLYTSLECIEDTCDGYIAPFPVDVHTTMRLSIADDGAGHHTLDATMGEIELDYELDGAEDIYLENCAIGTVEEVLNFVGLSIYDLLLSALGGTLQSQIAAMGPTLEESIEDAFASATIEQDLDLNGALVHLLVQPSNVDITPASMRLWMEGSFEGAPAECVAGADPGGSLRTDSDLPSPTDVPSGIGSDYHAGVLIGDDFANSALYAFWRGGLLCYSLDAASSPIPLDTSLLNTLSDDAFVDVFPEATPLTLSTRPLKPPEVTYTGEHDLGLAINDLDLDLYGELDGRAARIVSIELDGTAGADLVLDGASGNLAINVDLDPTKFTPTVSYNEIQPAGNASIESRFGGLLSTVLDSVVGGMLQDLSFALPSFSGLGLTDLEVAAAGDDADWLGAYAWLGPVSYGDGSCGGCGGSDTGGGSGCSGGGCSTVPGAPWAAAAAALTFWARRRQR